MQVPIFTGGQREIDLQNAHLNINEAKINMETAQKTVESDVKATWLQVESLQQTIVSLKAQVKANEQNYADLQNQYEAGAVTSLDTQIALSQLANSKTNLVTQTYQYQVACRDLQRAVAIFQNQRVKNARIPKPEWRKVSRLQSFKNNISRDGRPSSKAYLEIMLFSPDHIPSYV